jgi:hypothetical protein
LEPIPARQGGQVQVSGRGFAAGELVAISASKEPANGSATVAPGGTAAPKEAGGSATVAPGGPAASKEVSGSVMVPLGGTAAGPQGTFDGFAVSLPEELASGPHALQAVGQSSGRQSTGTLWIRAREPWLVLSTYEIQPFVDLGLIAGGFEPREAVRVTLEPRADPPSPTEAKALTELATDQAGNGEWAQVKLPLVRPGTYVLALHGLAGGLELRRDITIDSLKPTAELSPWAGPPGVPLQLNAHGFAPNERVHVAFGRPGLDATVLPSDADGNLWGAGPVRVPPTALMGPLAVVLTGEESGASARPEFSVLEIKPWLELTTWWGAPGVPVGFAGGGWIGGERVTFHAGSESAPVSAEAQADDYGWLHTSGLAYVPRDAATDVTFIAVGDDSHATARATYRVVFPFDLRPKP